MRNQKNLFKEGVYSHEKTAIRYEYLSNGFNSLFTRGTNFHHNGDINFIEKSDNNAKTLELYAQSGLTELERYENFGIVTSMDFADFIAEYLAEIT